MSRVLRLRSRSARNKAVDSLIYSWSWVKDQLCRVLLVIN